MDMDEMEDDVPHRPGKLYKLKPEFKKKAARKKAGTNAVNRRTSIFFVRRLISYSCVNDYANEL